ncbi:IclR family transcriptional regulator [Paraburkholderia sp.]|uniref:IclR family transcriptional regulator n=1 Tax=Paraburkholderia sp. TaxID=1926495 RepID=UPI0039E68183
MESVVAAPGGMDRGAAPAVTRAVAILNLLAARGAPQSLTEIAVSLGIAKSSVLNFCLALEAGGLIQRQELGYTLGRRTVELGGAYLRSFDQVREFYRICSESAVLGKQLLQIAMLDGRDVLYLARHEGHSPMRMSASIGDRFPASVTAVGNALLSLIPPAEIDTLYADLEAWPRFTDKSVASLSALHKKLAKVRERGYALDEGEVFSNVVGLAVVIQPCRSSRTALAIGASMFAPDDAPQQRNDVINELKRAASLLSPPMLIAES